MYEINKIVFYLSKKKISHHAADDGTFIDHHDVEVLILLVGVLPKLDTGRLHQRLVIAVLILLLHLREEGLLLLCHRLSFSHLG